MSVLNPWTPGRCESPDIWSRSPSSVAFVTLTSSAACERLARTLHPDIREAPCTAWFHHHVHRWPWASPSSPSRAPRPCRATHPHRRDSLPPLTKESPTTPTSSAPSGCFPPGWKDRLHTEDSPAS